MESSTISKTFALALVKAQGSIEGAKKGRENTFFKDAKGRAAKYADLAACWDACREALQDAGIAVVQFPTGGPQGHVAVRTVLVYGPTGETLSDTLHVPLKDPTNAQAMGSAITYGRRYALCAVIGICPEDDDGNAASAPARQGAATGKKAVPLKVAASADSFRSAFKMSSTIEGMKMVYTEAKNSDLEESSKQALLREMGDAIRAAKVKEEDTK